MKHDKRTFEQIREHYEVERELADKLRKGSKEERKQLYSHLYDELFKRIPHHPQLIHKKDSAYQQKITSYRMRFLKKYLSQDATFLEIGPGDCALSSAVAQHVKKVYAIDVSKKITQNETFPENLELIISDGCNIPLPENSISIAYSDQLIEHLHPEDAYELLQNLYKTITPGGIYICITPNALNGPHDISKYFDDKPTGLHLKEYTVTELNNLFCKVGFTKVEYHLNIRILSLKFSLNLVMLCEKLFLHTHPMIKRIFINNFIIKKLLNGILIAKKSL